MVMLLGESSEKVCDGRKSNVQEGKLGEEQDDGKEKDIKREREKCRQRGKKRQALESNKIKTMRERKEIKGWKTF